MRRFLIALLLWAPAVPLAAAEPTVAELQAVVEPVDLAGVHRGQQGYGLSVFEGATVERFGVEVVSVVTNFLPGQDEVLVRCSGWKLDETKVIGGMSGSPIYLWNDADRRYQLLGALAYGWSFSQEPLAGITPIQYMLAESRRPSERAPGDAAPPAGDDYRAFPPPAPGGADPAADGSVLRQAQGEREGAPRLAPLRTPLMCSGLSQQAVDRLRAQLAPFALEPMIGGGAGRVRPAAPVELAPGAALGVQLAEGDIDLTGIGTATYVQGDTVLGFGHPMFGAGEYDLPMTTAYIHTVVGSVARSFKFGSALERVGTIFGDRQSAIVGSFQRRTGMIPFRVRVENSRTGHGRDYRFSIIRHRRLTPIFLSGTLFDLAGAQEQSFGPTFCRRTLTMHVPGRAPLTFTNSYSTSSGVDFSTYDPVLALLFNDYERLEVERVDVRLEIVTRNPAVELLAVVADRPEYQPGAAGTLRVTLRAERAAPFEVAVPFTVPAHFPDGEYRLSVVGGGQLPPEFAQVRDVPSLIAALEEADRVPADSLVALFDRAEALVDYEGTRLGNLPDSVAAGLLEKSRDRRVVAGFRRTAAPPVSLDGFLPVNAGTVAITVRRRP